MTLSVLKERNMGVFDYMKKKEAMRESMIAQGFDVWSVMLNCMSFNYEYKEIIKNLNA